MSTQRRNCCAKKKGWWQGKEQQIKTVLVLLAVLMVFSDVFTRNFLQLDKENAMRDLKTNVTTGTNTTKNKSSSLDSASAKSALLEKLTPVIRSTKGEPIKEAKEEELQSQLSSSASQIVQDRTNTTTSNNEDEPIKEAKEEELQSQLLSSATQIVQDRTNTTTSNNEVPVEGKTKEPSSLYVPEIDYNYSFVHYEDADTRFPLPAWLNEFLSSQPVDAQHHHEMLTNPQNQFLVLTCYKYAGKGLEDCGGLTDRFFQLPYLMQLAHQHKRKLLIRYFKPYSLEAFLVPPQHNGFDWRLPPGYFQSEWEAYGNRTVQQYRSQRRFVYHKALGVEPWKSQRVIFINNNLAIPLVESKIKHPLHELWPGLFRRLFQPSQAVAQEMRALTDQLQAGTYASVHLRAKWPFAKGLGLDIEYNNKKQADKAGGGINMQNRNTSRAIAIMSHHALACAIRMMPNTSGVYVASDANEVVEYLQNRNNNTNPEQQVAQWNGGNRTSTDPMLHGWGVAPWQVSTARAHIVTRPHPEQEPLHFDGYKWNAPEGGYGIFIDLWMMAHAKCHSHGVGGFGRWASVLSGNRYICAARHRDYQNLVPSCATPDERKLWKAQQKDTMKVFLRRSRYHPRNTTLLQNRSVSVDFLPSQWHIHSDN